MKVFNSTRFLRSQWGLLCCALLLTATSCQKEESAQPSSLSVNSQADAKLSSEPKPVRNGKLLKFNTRKDFERVMREIGTIPAGMSMEEHLGNWEKKHNFYSLRAHKAKKAKDAAQLQGALTGAAATSGMSSLAASTTMEEDFTPVFYDPTTDPTTGGEYIQDDYLATILSPDQTVQIDNTIYHLDGASNHIYYAAADNGEIYDELISEQPSSPDIYYYPMDQDVFALQDAGVEGAVSTSAWSIGVGSGIGCGSNAPGKKHDGGVQYTRDQRLDCKLVYQSVGIYFSIIAKGESQNKWAGIWWAQTSSLSLVPRPIVKWLPKCETAWQSNSTTYYNAQQPLGNSSNRSKVTHRYYENTRGLAKFDCSVQMYDQGGRIAGPVLRISHL